MAAEYRIEPEAGAEYVGDYDVAPQDKYVSGAVPPQLMTVSNGRIVELKVTKELINDIWKVANYDEVDEALSN